MNTPDQMISEYIEAELSGVYWDSSQYSDSELSAAARRAACRDLGSVMAYMDNILKGRQS